ncbi:Asp23/Gls24 family envelope stress response protein [Gordonia sp. Z-3]|jgi:uncharacterized alkaline shock family protein YloU|uniref:Asp23/Gls24 family envelope stress response protein n=2 Tax=Gordonia TaxID=2053 RepID=A0A9X3I515_9ACTN|nr:MULTISPECIES: Asp23/Gls24 family envelope stress response protein [Gordonia]MAU84071.1 Asp23/Gls24 family envelope stress response protein [Gordonia sp. (in: high G+C Gram-positive bacteria)]MCF3937781.1 Asp23/Gls24 family envelope stress response protein [Gordonia tangerina]MCX2964781.1 Asp23/Gls24 family envelope stress response protein [Gordonia aquimaris]MED5800749.1 Asp23/Gls24 family envelope stress response protein [Gordonia sp. Z-3]
MSDTTSRTQSATIERERPSAATGGVGTSLVHKDPAGDRGRTSISDIVVAKIAGIATREIDGVQDVGGAAERVVGRVREALPGATTSTTQGIAVEVGERQAAVDVSIVADYGVAIHQLAAAIRRNVITAIEQMTGLEVTEVNVTVHDIRFEDDDEGVDETPRVQ